MNTEFWNQLCIAQLYFSMTMDMNKILLALQCDSSNQAEERTFGYLHTMIGNMGTNELQNFLRFTTGSSVFLSKKIKVLFNDTSGLGRRLFASTCSSTLYLPVSYSNYNDFFMNGQPFSMKQIKNGNGVWMLTNTLLLYFYISSYCTLRFNPVYVCILNQ